MKAIVTDSCIQCGVCPDICPEVFELPVGEKANVIVDTVPEELQDKAREACEACPVEAIVLEE